MASELFRQRMLAAKAKGGSVALSEDRLSGSAPYSKSSGHVTGRYQCIRAAGTRQINQRNADFVGDLMKRMMQYDLGTDSDLWDGNGNSTAVFMTSMRSTSEGSKQQSSLFNHTCMVSLSDVRNVTLCSDKYLMLRESVPALNDSPVVSELLSRVFNRSTRLDLTISQSALVTVDMQIRQPQHLELFFTKLWLYHTQLMIHERMSETDELTKITEYSDIMNTVGDYASAFVNAFSSDVPFDWDSCPEDLKIVLMAGFSQYPLLKYVNRRSDLVMRGGDLHIASSDANIFSEHPIGDVEVGDTISKMFSHDLEMLILRLSNLFDADSDCVAGYHFATNMAMNNTSNNVGGAERASLRMDHTSIIGEPDGFTKNDERADTLAPAVSTSGALLDSAVRGSAAAYLLAGVFSTLGYNNTGIYGVTQEYTSQAHARGYDSVFSAMSSEVDDSMDRIFGIHNPYPRGTVVATARLLSLVNVDPFDHMSDVNYGSPGYHDAVAAVMMGSMFVGTIGGQSSKMMVAPLTAPTAMNDSMTSVEMMYENSLKTQDGYRMIVAKHSSIRDFGLVVMNTLIRGQIGRKTDDAYGVPEGVYSLTVAGMRVPGGDNEVVSLPKRVYRDVGPVRPVKLIDTRGSVVGQPTAPPQLELSVGQDGGISVSPLQHAGAVTLGVTGSYSLVRLVSAHIPPTQEEIEEMADDDPIIPLPVDGDIVPPVRPDVPDEPIVQPISFEKQFKSLYKRKRCRQGISPKLPRIEGSPDTVDRFGVEFSELELAGLSEEVAKRGRLVMAIYFDAVSKCDASDDLRNVTADYEFITYPASLLSTLKPDERAPLQFSLIANVMYNCLKSPGLREDLVNICVAGGTAVKRTAIGLSVNDAFELNKYLTSDKLVEDPGEHVDGKPGRCAAKALYSAYNHIHGVQLGGPTEGSMWALLLSYMPFGADEDSGVEVSILEKVARTYGIPVYTPTCMVGRLPTDELLPSCAIVYVDMTKDAGGVSFGHYLTYRKRPVGTSLPYSHSDPERGGNIESDVVRRVQKIIVRDYCAARGDSVTEEDIALIGLLYSKVIVPVLPSERGMLGDQFDDSSDDDITNPPVPPPPRKRSVPAEEKQGGNVPAGGATDTKDNRSDY